MEDSLVIENMREKLPEYYYLKYFENTFRSEEFHDKRYYRYIKKIEDLIQKSLRMQISVMQMSISSCSLYWLYKLEADIDEPIGSGPAALIRYIPESMLDDLVSFAEEELQINYEEKLKNVYFGMFHACHEGKIGSQFIALYEVHRNYCIDEMLVRAFMRGEIREDNYSSYIPSEKEIPCLYADILTNLAYDMQVKLCQNCYEMLFHQYKEKTEKRIAGIDAEKERKEAEKAFNSMKDMFADLCIEKKKSQRLEEQKNAELEKERKLRKDALIEKEREINRLKKQIEQLKKKQERPPEQPEPTQITQTKEPECDPTRKYTFVMSPWPLFEGQLKEVFPNATIVSKMEIISKETSDLVIFMTSHMSHKFYKGIKNQCRDEQIPYLHFNSTNIKKLKKEIASVQNFAEI